MKFNPAPTWLYAVIVSLVAAVFVSVTGRLLASPSDEITEAVSGSGTTSVQGASGDAFLDAFSSVLVTVKQSESPSYVAAAVKMRPDLKDQIVLAAQDVYTAPRETDRAESDRVSRHRRLVPVCCHCPNPESCHTLYFSPREAREFLEKHPQCHRGVCPP